MNSIRKRCWKTGRELIVSEFPFEFSFKWTELSVKIGPRWNEETVKIRDDDFGAIRSPNSRSIFDWGSEVGQLECKSSRCNYQRIIPLVSGGYPHHPEIGGSCKKTGKPGTIFTHPNVLITRSNLEKWVGCRCADVVLVTKTTVV